MNWQPHGIKVKVNIVMITCFVREVEYACEFEEYADLVNSGKR